MYVVEFENQGCEVELPINNLSELEDDIDLILGKDIKISKAVFDVESLEYGPERGDA